MPDVLPRQRANPVAFRINDLHVDPTIGLVTGPEGSVRLEPRVLAVLQTLASQPGMLVSRSDLLSRIWPGTDIYDEALTQCVYQLRQQLAVDIRERALSWAVGWAEPEEIDEINILAATMLAMRRAIGRLDVTPAGVQVDGNRLPNLSFGDVRLEGEAIVGGDGKIAAIGAASILAKTTRDGIMEFLDRIYPEYEFARHKGYGTQVHLERLRRHGPCAQHRASFAPVRAAG